MAMPQQPSQLLNIHAMALQPAAHGQALQGNAVLLKALDQGLEGLFMPKRRVNLHRIRLNGLKQRDDLLWSQSMVAFLD